MVWSISERMGHCLQGKGWLCLFGAHSDPDHKGFPAKYTMDVISNTWRVSMVTQKHEGTPGEWLWTTFSFVIFVFHYIWHFWSWAFKEIPVLEEHTGDIFQWNVEQSQKKTSMAENVPICDGKQCTYRCFFFFFFYISQMKYQHIVLRSFRNKQITKLYLPFVCFQTSVMLTVSLGFDVFNSRIHLCRLEKFQSISHCRYKMESVLQTELKLKCIISFVI